MSAAIPPKCAVRTERFAIERGPYLRAVVAPFFDGASAALVALVLVGGALVGAQRGAAVGARTVAVGLGVYAAFGLLAYARARKAAYRREARHDVLRDFEFSESGILIRMDGRTDSNVPWERIRRVVRRQGHTFLYFDANRYYPIPDRAFRSPDDLQVLLSLASRKGLRATPR